MRTWIWPKGPSIKSRSIFTGIFRELLPALSDARLGDAKAKRAMITAFKYGDICNDFITGLLSFREEFRIKKRQPRCIFITPVESKRDKNNISLDKLFKRDKL
jgi:hypothetical protein